MDGCGSDIVRNYTNGPSLQCSPDTRLAGGLQHHIDNGISLSNCSRNFEQRIVAMDRRLLWLAVGAFATSTMAFVFAGLLPLVAADTHVTISTAARLVMAYSLAYAIGTPILATLTGAADRKRVVVGALALFVAGNIIAATSNSFVVLTSAQIVMGM